MLQAHFVGDVFGEAWVRVRSFELNTGLADALFQFEIPEGAEVIEIKDLQPIPLTLDEARAQADFSLLVPAYVPEGVTQFSAGGENGLFILKPEQGIASLPIGKYRINEWMLEQKDENDTPWRLKGAGRSGRGQLFDVAVDKVAELSIGEPVVSTLRASSRQGTYSFRYDMAGRDGERIELTRNGARPRAPKLHIKSKDGTYDRTYSFQYG